MKPDDPKLKASLAALADLIVATLQTGEPGRFAVAARLCQTAHTLARETGTRVEDFEEGLEQDPYGPYVMANPIRGIRARQRGAIMGGGMQDFDVGREMVGGLLPLMERYQDAQREQADAQTLQSLIAVRERVGGDQCVVINQRINAIIASIDERNRNNANAAAVVPPVVLRGHPPGAHELGLPAHPGAADAAGAEGRDGAPGDGAQAPLPEPAVGHGG